MSNETCLDRARDMYFSDRTGNLDVTQFMTKFADAEVALANKWVRCDEQLPDHPGYFDGTVYDPWDHETSVQELQWSTLGGWIGAEFARDREVVIAWRERPQPYTEADTNPFGRRKGVI